MSDPSELAPGRPRAREPCRNYQMIGAGGQEFLVEVDGERFRVRTMEPKGQRYSYNDDWLTGPKPDYGFNCSRGLVEFTYDDHVSSIRDFLADIDPETGYMAD